MEEIEKFIMLREDLDRINFKYFSYLRDRGICVFIKGNKVVIERNDNPYAGGTNFLFSVASLGIKKIVEWYENVLGERIENLVDKTDNESIAKVGLFVFFLTYYSYGSLRLSDVVEFIDVCEKYLPLIKMQVSRI